MAPVTETPVYAGQRVLRTAFTTALTLLPIIPQILFIITDQWDVEVLTVIAAEFIAINTALTRIIALPGVDQFLASIGLGAEPKSVVGA